MKRNNLLIYNMINMYTIYEKQKRSDLVLPLAQERDVKEMNL